VEAGAVERLRRRQPAETGADDRYFWHDGHQ
jgi:hypothetical protein